MPAPVELYICSRCGVTNETHKAWGPICPETGERVCDECCYHCGYHKGWSGIWHCEYISEEVRKEEIRKRIKHRFEDENLKASMAARDRWRAKKAKAGKRNRQNPGRVH